MFLPENKPEPRWVIVLKKIVRYSLAVFVSYFLAWTIAYMLITYNAVLELDFSEYFHWLALAWTFTGLEMVAITWFLSMVIFFPLAITSVVLLMRRDREKLRSSAQFST